MLIKEFSELFDVYYNNITSNQAPGLSEYEKSVFLTRAEKEIVKNYFSSNSKGNSLGQGFDDSAKRQADFSVLMETGECSKLEEFAESKKIDDRSIVFTFPADTFIVINEAIKTSAGNRLQVIPLRYDEYCRLMSKPYKRPLKYQAWRLINSGNVNEDVNSDKGKAVKRVEIITNSWDEVSKYSIRYIRVPEPIILADFSQDGLTIDGGSAQSTKCEIDPILHEDILQRAVELAKMSWTITGQDNTEAVLQTGQRSE